MKNYFIIRLMVSFMAFMVFSSIINAATGTITFTVHGTIKDEETHQPLVAVVVTLHDGSAGTVTDEKGPFSIDVTSNDERRLVDISYIGYEKKTVSVANDAQ